MNVYDAILSRRSIRRFQQKQISIDLLKKFINAARLAPSAANLQPLEFYIVNDKELCSKVFNIKNLFSIINITGNIVFNDYFTHHHFDELIRCNLGHLLSTDHVSVTEHCYIITNRKNVVQYVGYIYYCYTL